MFFIIFVVVCLKCKGKSNTYDPVLDISLDIKVITIICIVKAMALDWGL